MNIKRTAEMSQLEREVMNMMWKDVKNTPHDNQWRRYERKFTYLENKYKVTCFFKHDNDYFTYKKLVISHDTQTIIIPQGSELH